MKATTDEGNTLESGSGLPLSIGRLRHDLTVEELFPGLAGLQEISETFSQESVPQEMGELHFAFVRGAVWPMYWPQRPERSVSTRCPLESSPRQQSWLSQERGPQAGSVL